MVIVGVMFAAHVPGLVGLYAAGAPLGIAGLWAMMCLALGALIGFLFGVPQTNVAQVQGARFWANSNIEQLSDWLTKMIVGVGLVEMGSIQRFIDQESSRLGAALVSVGRLTEVQAPVVAKGMMVYFFAAGIIQGYLLTRTYLTREFESAQRA